MKDRREVKHVEKLPKGITLGRNNIIEKGKPVRVIAQKRRTWYGEASGLNRKSAPSLDFIGFKLRIFRRE